MLNQALKVLTKEILEHPRGYAMDLSNRTWETLLYPCTLVQNKMLYQPKVDKLQNGVPI